MSVRSEIKYLLFEENSSIKNLAGKLTAVTGKKYTMKSLSQKLTRGTLRAEEYKIILGILGYDLKVIKKKQA